ncbi:hypothetical protein DFQ28_007345 [Apophysomyces sp. BC1034]|nr:hypothetical protein DFQ30_002468 [Apophysomyces sp. BC1015]KAG0192872.1 hypothetical protein DFQ28_007345 [Apophysomyces sp. BC1034]
MFRPLVRRRSQQNDKDKTIGQLDVIYRTLLKLGFDAIDIERSMEASMSLHVEDHLDWSPEKTESQSVRQVIVPEPPRSFPESEAKSNPQKDDDDYKSRIMRAAQQYLEDSEEEENVNEKHARLKFELAMLEKQLPSKKGKKNKKHKNLQLSDTEVVEVQKKIDKLQQSLRNLEADWEYDKFKAAELYVSEQQRAAEEREQQKHNEPDIHIPDDTPEPLADEQPTEDDDDDGGLFGGLLSEEMEEVGTHIESSVSTWTVVNIATPSWKGIYPKDQLQDYCKRHGHMKQTYSTSNVGAGLWRASIIITSKSTQDPRVVVDIPPGIATLSSQDAEQLAAVAALFHFDSEAAIYRSMPPTMKDLWLKWKEDKKQQEEIPRLEADRRRMQFLSDLLDMSSERRRSSLGEKHLEISTLEDKNHTTPASRESFLKRKEVFFRVQQHFAKRLKTEGYGKMKANELPVAAYRKDILKLVKENQIIIISGETGCGKSTQVPQFLAEDLLQGAAENGMVICTQPRRISAISIAHRVSAEMGDRPRSTGSSEALVGYQIRLESKSSKENVLLFCTTGILLRRLESDQYLEGVTHVVVDEVHERTVESDFLLIILKRLCDSRPDLRVILMSATVEAHRFSAYFGNCPVLSVPGRTYPVQVQYLEDVVEATDQGSVNVSGRHGTSKRVRVEWFEEDTDDEDPYDPARVESKLKTINDEEDIEEDKSYSRQTRKMIRRMDEHRINYDLVLQLFEYICNPSQRYDTNIPETGAILVFLPGMPEIRRLYDLISGHSLFGDPRKFLLIALHSTLSSEHQERAFDIPPEGVRKIVLSTNIAETGVTISDVTIVIDTGMAKIVSYEEKKRITRLRQAYVAKANARQRRGRAGRVQEGICFHLFTQERYEKMADYETPEILRLPLEELCLRIKVCKLGAIDEVLGAALDAPSKSMVDSAIQNLQEVQALSSDEFQNLTPLGVHLANLPVDIHIGKMILFGAIFRCLDPVLTIAASLSFKSPFVRPFGKESEADAAREKFRHADSDFWTIYKAYCCWREQLEKVRQQPGWTRKMREFCSKHFLSEQNLEMIEDMKKQYLELLVSIGFVKAPGEVVAPRYELKRMNRMCHVPSQYDVYSNSVAVVNAAIVAGLYPKVTVYSHENRQFMNNTLAVQIHPSSVLHCRQGMLAHDFLVYNTIVMSDKVYLWETASINAAVVMLLARDMDIKHKKRCVVLDRWIPFQCYARTAVLIKFLRTELNNWLAAKMDRPNLDLTSYGQEIMDVWIKTLESQM